MEKPEYLSETLYREIITATENISENILLEKLEEYGYKVTANDLYETMLIKILDDPSAFLANEVGIFEDSTLLGNIVFAFNDGEQDSDVDYLIDERAAQEITEGTKYVTLRRVYDNKARRIQVTRIRHAFENHCEIDYVEK